MNKSSKFSFGFVRQTLFAVGTLLLLSGCDCETHFITDKQYRAQVHADFIERQQLARGRAGILFSGMDTLSCRDREALEFLYSYMPYSDLADYDAGFFLKQVRCAFAARETFSWGKTVPEDVFRHFVLVYRVNNEDLDTARMLMFNELKDRVKDLSMEQAALEVNHWCHEYVAYRAADMRTSAPLATMRTSLGRCGEESTFTVTALRAVGIPARQCYTPRWAHCDDNHAWVEAWVDGEWKFLGACEPDPELNMGWFSVPSTRCMMVHSKAFGRYHGDEEVVVQTPLYSELNLLAHYAPTRRVTVSVCDETKQPVTNAVVSFKLYNYSEYYTLASISTDSEGKASLTTGLGDLLVWATDGNKYGYNKLDVRQDSAVFICLTRTPNIEYVEQLDIVPPAAGEAKVVPSEDAVARNTQRIAHEDSVRQAYTATFCNEKNYKEKLKLPHCLSTMTEAQLCELMVKAEGNYAEVGEFISKHYCDADIYSYLRSFSDKDLRDTPAEVFESQYTQFSELTAHDPLLTTHNYKKGIQPARISNELVRPWRHFLAEALPKAGVEAAAESIRQWTLRNISVDEKGNYYHCPISPRGVFELRHSDPHSRDIFFVAACRSMNVPAYLDNATNIIYVWDKATDDWQKMSFAADEGKSQPTASLTLTYQGENPEVPVYWPHFALAKYENGDFVTFDFEGDARLEKFPATLHLEPGYYCLFTGNRYPEGDVLSRMEFFTLQDEESRSVEIILRPLAEKKKQNYAVINIDFPIDDAGMIYIDLGDYREPSKHLVKEMQEQRKALEKWGGEIYMLAPDNVDAKSWSLPNVEIVSPQDAGILGASLLKVISPSQEKPDFPFVACISRNGEIIFHSQGYRIGLAEQMLGKFYDLQNSPSDL